MPADVRITTARIKPGTVIMVERRPDGTLASTRRKKGSFAVTVTGKDPVQVDGGRQVRYVIHTDGGSTKPGSGSQTFTLVALPSVDQITSGSADGIDATVSQWNNALAGGDPATIDAARRATIGEITRLTMDDDPRAAAAGWKRTDTAPDIPADVPADPAALWEAYQAAVDAAAAADGPPPVRLDMRPRVETFRGRKLRTERGTEWGTVRTSINGERAETVGTAGSGPEGLDRAAAALRHYVIGADARRVTDPDAYPAHWFTGAPDADPAIVAYLRHAAERERADRAALAAASCTGPGHVPGVLGCAPSVKDCNGIPTRAEHLTGRPIPAAHDAAECGTDTIGRAIGHALALRHQVDGPVMTCESDPYGRGDVRPFGTWSLAVNGYAVTVVSYTARPGQLLPERRYAAVLVRGRLIGGAGDVPMEQTPVKIAHQLEWHFRNWITDQPACAECAARWHDDRPPCAECMPGQGDDTDGDGPGGTAPTSGPDVQGPSGALPADGDQGGTVPAATFTTWADVTDWITGGRPAAAPAVAADTSPAAVDGGGHRCVPDSLINAGQSVSVLCTARHVIETHPLAEWPGSSAEARFAGRRALVHQQDQAGQDGNAGAVTVATPAAVGRHLTVVNDAHGAITVHKPGCRDIRAALWSWDVTAPDLRAVIADLYSEFEGFTVATWRDYAGDVTVAPCAGDLPDEHDEPAAPVGQADTVPVVAAPAPGDVVTVRGWSVPFQVTALEGGKVIGEVTPGDAAAGVPAEIARVPAGMITSVRPGTSPDGDQDQSPALSNGDPVTFTAKGVQRSGTVVRVKRDGLITVDVPDSDGGTWWDVQPQQIGAPTLATVPDVTRVEVDGVCVAVTSHSDVSDQAPDDDQADDDEDAAPAPAPTDTVPTRDGVPAGMPYVVPMPAGWRGDVVRLVPTDIGKLLRGTKSAPGVLAHWFPGVKFSVRSGWDGVDISWTDGPAGDLVDVVTDWFQGQDFDGMDDSTRHRGPVLLVDGAGNATAYSLPGVYVSVHRGVTEQAARPALALLEGLPESLNYGEYSDPFGRPWHGGPHAECARWMARNGVDEWTRTRGIDQRPGCPVERCALAAGHPFPAMHRNDYGRVFLALPADGGNGGNGGNGGGEPTSDPTDPAPADDQADDSDPADVPATGYDAGSPAVQAWQLLGAVTSTASEQRTRMFRAMRRVHGLAELHERAEIMREAEALKSARDLDSRSWPGKCAAYLRTYGALLTEDDKPATSAAEPAPAPRWWNGKPKAGQLVTVPALNRSDGQPAEGVTLVAERVTHLGCGCWKIESDRPGPYTEGGRNWVAVHTGCAFHERTVCTPEPFPFELLDARRRGAEWHADGVPVDALAAGAGRDLVISTMIGHYPVGDGAQTIRDAFRTGYTLAAEKFAADGVSLVEHARTLAATTQKIANRNPAAQPMADQHAGHVDLCARELAAREATAEQARTLAGAAIPSALVLGTARTGVTTSFQCAEHGTVTVDAPTDSAEVERASSLHGSCTPGDPYGAAQCTPDAQFARTMKITPKAWVTAHLTDEEKAPALAEPGHADPAVDQVDTVPAAEAPAPAEQGDADPDAESIYTAPVDWYAPQLDSDPDADITITHDHENGTVMDGGRKGDGTLEIVGTFRFQWRRFAGVHIPGSRDRFADLVSIDKAAKALRAAGHTVAVDIDDVWRPAAVREEARGRRADARTVRLTERAGGAYAKAEGRRLAARNIADGMPLAEPIKVGHHSERAHRRAFDRIEANDRASWAAQDYAEHLASRAAGAESNEQAKHNPRAIMRRIETMEADMRRWERSRADAEGHGAAGQQRRSVLEAEKLAEDIAYQRAKLGDLAASGAFVAWSGEHLRKGDTVNIGGRWCEVARVNRKGVSVLNRWPWSTATCRPEPVKWDDIHGRRRDDMQWDSPNAEPYSVQEAQRAARWRSLVRDTSRRVSGEPDADVFRRIHVTHAVRIVLGLARDSADAEVYAFGEPDGRTAQRVRALACLAVFERLEAGETFTDVAATVTPIGDTVPTWTMPDVEPIDVFAGDLVAGDVINGLYDNMFGGNQLYRSFAGPLASPPTFENRRESGDWYTIRLTTGEETEVKSHRRISVRRPAPAAATVTPGA